MSLVHIMSKGQADKVFVQETHGNTRFRFADRLLKALNFSFKSTRVGWTRTDHVDTMYSLQHI